VAIETQLGNYEGGLSMRTLLVVDGSSYSDIATKTLEALRLPSPTEVTVMTVAPQTTFLGGVTLIY